MDPQVDTLLKIEWLSTFTGELIRSGIYYLQMWQLAPPDVRFLANATQVNESDNASLNTGRLISPGLPLRWITPPTQVPVSSRSPSRDTSPSPNLPT